MDERSFSSGKPMKPCPFDAAARSRDSASLEAVAEDFNGHGGVFFEAQHRLGNEKTAHVGGHINQEPGIAGGVFAPAADDLSRATVKRVPGVVHNDDIAEFHWPFLPFYHAKALERFL
jgi:hypothetical protein